MQVANHFFENGIAYFTRRINKCISLACANGDVAPFVGHNAFLRWSAIQEAAFLDEDGVRKIWSESNVSEDFDMALRLQVTLPLYMNLIPPCMLTFFCSWRAMLSAGQITRAANLRKVFL